MCIYVDVHRCIEHDQQIWAHDCINMDTFTGISQNISAHNPTSYCINAYFTDV